MQWEGGDNKTEFQPADEAYKATFWPIPSLENLQRWVLSRGVLNFRVRSSHVLERTAVSRLFQFLKTFPIQVGKLTALSKVARIRVYEQILRMGCRSIGLHDTQTPLANTRTWLSEGEPASSLPVTMDSALRISGFRCSSAREKIRPLHFILFLDLVVLCFAYGQSFFFCKRSHCVNSTNERVPFRLSPVTIARRGRVLIQK